LIENSTEHDGNKPAHTVVLDWHGRCRRCSAAALKTIIFVLAMVRADNSAAAEVISKVDSVVFDCTSAPKAADPKASHNAGVVKNPTTVGTMVRAELEKRCVGQSACELNVDTFLSEQKIDFQYCKDTQNHYSIAYRCGDRIKFTQLYLNQPFKSECQMQ